MYHDVPIGRLIDDAIEHLRNQGLSESPLTSYRNVWLQVALYADQHDFQFYSPEVEEGYLQERFKDLGIAFSEKWACRLSMLIKRLNEFWESGGIRKRTKLSPSFASTLGQSIKDFLDDKISRNRFSKYTIRQDTYYLSVFLDYANKHGLHELDGLRIEAVNLFLDSLPREKKSLRHHIIRALRLYLSYLYDEHLIGINLSRLLPRDAYRKETKLPSIYSRKR